MVKTPRTRHSKSTKEPVTIDLSPGEVARVKSEREEADAARGAMDEASGVADHVDSPESGATAAAEGSTDPTDDQPATGENPDAGTQPDESPALEKEAVETSQEQAFGREQPSEPRQEPPRRGSGAALLAGVAGGVIALALAGGLQFAGVLPVAGPGGAGGADVAALEARIDELQGQVVSISQAAGEASALTERLSSVEQRIQSLGAEFELLRAELAGAGNGDGTSVDLAPLEERIASLETAIAGIGGAANPEAALAALEEQFETLRGEVSQAQQARSATDARLDALEQQVGDIASRLEEQAEAPGTAVIIAASALKAAIDRGGPFMTELETFASLAPDAPEIAQLRELAATGVPTRAEIAAESDAAANTMIAAARPSDPDAGIVDRLWGSAMGLVQVRPIGMVEGEGVAEIVARIDAAVTSNNYGRAIEEFETLPEAAKSAGEPFMAKVRARHSADALIDQALAAALKA